MATKVTIQNGQFQDAAGNAIAGTLTLQLSQDAVVTGTGTVAPTIVSIVVTAGNAVATPIWGNDNLTPSGTVYVARLFDASGSTVWGPENWSITGAGPIELNTLVPSSNSASYPTAVLTAPSGDQTIKTNNLLPAAGNTTQSLGSSAAPWNAALYSAKVTNLGQLNNIRIVDGVNFGPDWAAGITAADTDLGATPGEIWVTSKAGLSSTVAPTVTWANGRVLRFVDPTTYTLSVGWTINGWTNQQAPGAFLGVEGTELKFTGSAGMVFDGTAATNLMQMRIEKIRFSGNALVANALTLKGLARSVFDNIKAANCTGAAILCQFLANCVFIQPKVTSSDKAFTTQPTNGILIDWVTAAANASNDVTVFAADVGGVSGSGIKVDHASECHFFGGETTSCNVGIELTSGDGSTTGWGHSIENVHFDINNTVNDILITGFRNMIRNCVAATGTIQNLNLSGASANENLILGGIYNKITVGTGATTNSFVNAMYAAGTGGSFTDSGTNTMKVGLRHAGALDASVFITGVQTPTVTISNAGSLVDMSVVNNGAIRVAGGAGKAYFLDLGAATFRNSDASNGGSVQFSGTVGFNNTAPIAKPTVTGAKGGNAALGSLMTALANYGLVTDSTTA